MKTTINMADDLFTEAKKAAVERKITFTELLEQAIRHELSGRKVPYVMEDCTFNGEIGLQPGVDLSDWSRIRELIYEGDEN